MFMSISRGRVKFRPKYICASCLTNLLPHPGLQIPNHEPFSTTSIYRHRDDNNTSNALKTNKKSAVRRRRGRMAEPISHSRDALAALKDSLAAEERASKVPIPKSKSETMNNNKEAQERVKFAKSRKASPDVKKKLVAKNPMVVVKSTQTSQDIVEKTAQIGSKEASPRPEKKAVNFSEKAKSPAKPKKPTKRRVSSTTENAVVAGAVLAQTMSDEVSEALLPPSKNPKARSLTDIQRHKIEGILLGAKNKRSAALSKTINTNIRAIGENETKKALVKIIEDGQVPKSDISKAFRRVLSEIIKSAKLPDSETTKPVRKINSNLKIRGMTGRTDMGRVVPQIRAILSSPPPMVNRGLKEALQEAHLKKPPAPPPRSRSLTRSPARAPTRAPTQARRGRARNGPLTVKPGFEIKTLDAADLELKPVVKTQPPVPTLSYGLDRVLFNPGVYHLQDPRSRVFNFDPYLQTIMPVEEFDFTALKRYITSSRDENLLATAREESKKYTGSTSSMTAALAHFHFLLSQWRPINTGILSQNFPVEYHTFTQLQRGPSAVFLKWKDGVYAIDADKQFDTANILSTLGKSMEKLLTLPTEDFEKYRKENSDQISLEEREAAEPFNYTTMGDFLMRSQLDAHDARLPGSGMFDLKTRAVVSIRMDVAKYEQGRDYEIRQRYGEYESFEREYYDMIRSAFLKYSLQVRMGRMDGIFVAFHNTQRIFGFQYISQPEMDLALHGTEDTTIGDAEFKLSLELLNKVLDKAAAKYPERSLRLHIETRDTEVPFMYIFAEPMDDEQIIEIQESNKAVIEEFEERVLGLSGEGLEEMEEPEPEEKLTEEERKSAEWASMRAQVEETMEKDELDLEQARTLAENMIEESDIFGTEDISAEEKEKLINDLLESSAFSEMEDEEPMVLKEDRDTQEDGIEGASANSESDNTEEDEDGEDAEDEDEEDDDEVGETEVVDEEQGEGVREKSEIIEELESLEQVEVEDTNLLIDEVPTNNFIEEPEIEASDPPAGPSDSVESVDTNHDSATVDAKDIADTESAKSGIGENKKHAPSEEVFEGHTQESDTSSKSTPKNTDQETEAANPAASDTGVTTAEPDPPHEPELLAMTLTIRNKVNGEYIDRPNKLKSEDNWTIEYALEDVSPARAASLYQACKTRRARTLSNARRDVNDAWNNRFMQTLWALSHKGKKWRERQNEIDNAEPLKVLDLDKIKADGDSWEQKETEGFHQTASENKE